MAASSRGRKFTSLIHMAKRIGESTPDDVHGSIFAEVVYD